MGHGPVAAARRGGVRTGGAGLAAPAEDLAAGAWQRRWLWSKAASVTGGASHERPRAVSDAADEAPVAVAAARTEDAVKVYGSGEIQVRALDGVSIAFEQSRFTAIMGPSGSGKSTLLHCMAALDDLTEGRACIGDTDLGALTDKELTRLRRDRMGFVFQAFNLVPTLTALENITLPIELARRRPDREWLDSLIATVGLGDRLGHRPNELSGGQQQRVAVARALAGRPDVIFADEPTGNLDSRSGAEVLRLMRQAVDDFGQTIVMVTHDARAASFADRAVFLSDGIVRGELIEPSAELILDRMKILQVGQFIRGIPDGATMEEVLEFMEDLED